MELRLPELRHQETKVLNMPIVRNKTRMESFCENCRQDSIKWRF